MIIIGIFGPAIREPMYSPPLKASRSANYIRQIGCRQSARGTSCWSERIFAVPTASMLGLTCRLTEIVRGLRLSPRHSQLQLLPLRRRLLILIRRQLLPPLLLPPPPRQRKR